MTPLSGSANAAHPPQDILLPNPKARLQDQFHEVARFKHLSPRSEQAYWEWVVRFLKFHRNRAGDWRHPRDLGSRAVTPFLTWLATKRDVAVSTRCPAAFGMRMLGTRCRATKPTGRSALPQRRRRVIFVVYHSHRFKLRRSGIFGFELPDDVAPDGALTILKLQIYNDASPTDFAAFALFTRQVSLAARSYCFSSKPSCRRPNPTPSRRPPISSQTCAGGRWRR